MDAGTEIPCIVSFVGLGIGWIDMHSLVAKVILWWMNGCKARRR